MKWKKPHELKALLVYRQVQEGGNGNDLCSELKNRDESFICSVDSIKMKIKNIQFLDTGKGLKKASQLNQKIFEKYKNHSMDGLKKEINKQEAKGNA